MPDNHYMIYDAGHWTHKNETFASIQKIVPSGSEIDFLVLSHSDSDHAGVIPKIFNDYTVKKVIRGGLERQTNTWGNADTAINTATNTEVNNFKNSDLPFGATYRYGETLVTFVSGFYAPPDEWDQGQVDGHRDPVGDDSVDVLIKSSGMIEVEYKDTK